jgi:hypothetical protein
VQRCRRGIVVERRPQNDKAPSGAAYSEDVAPDGAFKFFPMGFYKDVAPMALQNSIHAVSKVLSLTGFLKCLSFEPEKICLGNGYAENTL